MKHFLYLFLTLIISNFVFAQIQQTEKPISIQQQITAADVPTIQMPNIDIEALKREDESVDKISSIPWRYGYIHYTDIGFENGNYTNLANGDRIWRISIKSEGAQTLNFTFNQYKLTGNAKLFIYNKDYSETLGAFTKANNKDHGGLTTTLIEGDEITIELYEPRNTFGQNKLNIERVVHGYRSLDYRKQYKDIGSSGSCNINSICSLGDNWRDQIKSVGILLNQNSYSAGFCTGALINNTCNDGEPYFLTANHCMQGASPNNIVVGFNFESTVCNTNNWSGANNTVSSTQLVANNPDSDVALLKLSSIPPPSYEVFYAGWDRTTNFSSSQIGIHHPSGDLKKICRDDNPPTQVTYDGALCWRVGNWEQGVTEQGSSGSPLFNNNGLIIGQLYAGEARCDNLNDGDSTNDFDVYGRFDISWENSTDIARQLKHWLDPCGTNATTLEGYDPNAIIYDDDAAIRYAGNTVADLCGSKLTQNITIRNRGNNTLTSMTISYGFDNDMQNFNWTGNLTSGQSETLLFDSVSLSNGNHDFMAYIVSTNLANDSNQVNDTISFSTVIQDGVEVSIRLNTNFNGGENSLEIVEFDNNNIVETESGFGALQSYSFDYCLPEGSYCIDFYDDGGDGLAPSFIFDQGNYQLIVNGQEIYNTDAVGSGVSYCFSYNNGVFNEITTSIQAQSTFSDFQLYPNPNNGSFVINSESQIQQLEVYNVAGALIQKEEVQTYKKLITLSKLSRGMYLVKVQTEAGIGIKKIIIE